LHELVNMKARLQRGFSQIATSASHCIDWDGHHGTFKRLASHVSLPSVIPDMPQNFGHNIADIACYATHVDLFPAAQVALWRTDEIAYDSYARGLEGIFGGPSYYNLFAMISDHRRVGEQVLLIDEGQHLSVYNNRCQRIGRSKI
jgi:hypothetical protein